MSEPSIIFDFGFSTIPFLGDRRVSQITFKFSMVWVIWDRFGKGSNTYHFLCSYQILMNVFLFLIFLMFLLLNNKHQSKIVIYTYQIFASKVIFNFF